MTRPGSTVLPVRSMAVAPSGTGVVVVGPDRRDDSVLDDDRLPLARRRTGAVDHAHVGQRDHWRFVGDVGRPDSLRELLSGKELNGEQRDSEGDSDTTTERSQHRQMLAPQHLALHGTSTQHPGTGSTSAAPA